MADKPKTSLKSSGKSKVPPTQKTLLDHFPKKKPQTPTEERTESIETPPRLTGAANGGSLDDPIIVDESPVKPKNTFYPIFNTSKFITPPKLTSADAPFPDSESQHVRGRLHSFSLSQISFQQRTKDPANTHWDISNAPLNIVTLDTVPSAESSPPAPSGADIERCLQSIPIEHRQGHPAILKFVSATSSPSSSTSQIWAEKWRPVQAVHVLGNESQATYLRDWLKALEVQSESTEVPPAAQSKTKMGKKILKRSRVIRAVAKPRGRKKQRVDSEDDDWIVNSSDMGEDDQIDSEDEYLPVYTSRPAFDRHLTNTIILTGPTGCGKTSAVYACAEELGWEVFEVYPGIGKRSGANVDNLVGEVGKNHLVRATQSRGHSYPRDRNAFAALLQGEYHDRRDQQAHASSEFGFVEQSRNDQAVRQSLILLEEVDILYREDISFWSSVVSLIRECKRPVICTCNGDAYTLFSKIPHSNVLDLSLVPTKDLPLQATLVFHTCPTPVAVSYLQALCCAEGFVIQQDILCTLYEATPDLRRVIQQLQFWGRQLIHCANEQPTDIVNQESTQISGREARFTDLLSFNDSFVEPNGTLKTTLRGHSGPSADDELGYPILYDPLTTDDNFQQADEWNGPISRGLDVDVFRARVRFKDEVKDMISHAAVPQFTSEHGLFLDYLPWIRQMAEVDDLLESKQSATQKRTTRNSQGYIRTIPLTMEQRRVMEISSLPKVV